MARTLFNEHSKKIKYALSFIRKRIIHVNLQILYQCNFKCNICDFWKTPHTQKPLLSLSQVKIITEKLKDIGPQVISIGGGEPLLHPEVIEIARVLSKDNFGVMITNGWYVTKDIAQDLFKAGLYEISVSVDYADPKKHDKMRGKEGAFDRAVEALYILNKNRTHPYQRIHMITTVGDDNIEDIEPLIHLCKDIGVTYLISYYSNNRGNFKPVENEKTISDHLVSLHNKYRHFVALRDYLTGISKGNGNNDKPLCFTGKNLINIDSQGSISLCIDRLDESAGNIFTDNMSTILHNLTKMHKTNTCNNCWTSCRGSIETILYGKQRLANLFDYYQMTREVKLGQRF
ncbi:MAG: radical SAM protein [Proteobacteria bacterium]|nr:radical SAM protein [Pseudomonadota bacterium]